MLSAQELISFSFQNLEMETKLLTSISQSLCCSGEKAMTHWVAGWLAAVGGGVGKLNRVHSLSQPPFSSEECLGKSSGFASLAARFWPWQSSICTFVLPFIHTQLSLWLWAEGCMMDKMDLIEASLLSAVIPQHTSKACRNKAYCDGSAKTKTKI